MAAFSKRLSLPVVVLAGATFVVAVSLGLTLNAGLEEQSARSESSTTQSVPYVVPVEGTGLTSAMALDAYYEQMQTEQERCKTAGGNQFVLDGDEPHPDQSPKGYWLVTSHWECR
jgi:hypothetical protein